MDWKRKNVSRVLACFLALLWCFPVWAASSRSKASDACNGVVRILTLYEDDCASTGSGFGVGKAGEETDIYVTNWHVAVQPCEHGYSPIEVYILLDDHAVTYRGFDETRAVRCDMLATTTSMLGVPDYAILQADRRIPDHVALPLLSDAECEVSDTVYALGFPGNGDIANGGEYLAAMASEVTLTSGTISRFLDNFSGVPYEVIQHSAHINHGNSGGPLVNEEGAVIGINTYGFGDSTVNMTEGSANASEYAVAVSIQYVMNALDRQGISYDTYKSGGFLWAAVPAAVLALAAAAVCAVVLKKKKKTKLAAAPVGGMNGGGGIPSPAPFAGQLKQPKQPKMIQTALKLKGVSGYFNGRTFAFSGDQYQLGTGPSCKLKYPAGTAGISSVHCMLLIQNGALYLRDAGSQYGTFLNGNRLVPNQAYRLKPGDVFFLATSQEAFQVVQS